MTLSSAFIETSNLDNVPEEFDGVLDSNHVSICCSFNRYGSLLAVGYNDGRIIIWDFLTRGIARSIQGHVHPVCSVSWSRNGHKLVSASTDNTLAVWDVMNSGCIFRWRFPSPILKVQFNPRNSNLVLVCPLKHAALLIHLNENNECKHDVLPTEPDDTDPNIVASFDRRGQYIYTGNGKGRLVICKCPSNLNDNLPIEIVSSIRIQTGSTPAAIREIEFAPRNKTYFLVNSSDRTIRLYRCDDVIKAGHNGFCEEVRRFQDLVNKTMWKRCCFSGDPDASHVCGGSSKQHSLYIWETSNGTIKKMLHGKKGETLNDVQWHPLRPIIASISNGLVSLWTKVQSENWSAFAPYFKELEENLEYEERESEFDLEDEDKPAPQKEVEDEDETLEVDVVGLKSEGDFISSDEEGEDPNALVYLPIVTEEQDPEQMDGQAKEQK